MEKVIKIDNKEVRFKASASFAYRYKNQFGKDVLQEIMPILSRLDLGGKDFDVEEIVEALGDFEITTLYNLIWVTAKTVDNTIDEPMIWYDTFNEFPLIDVSKELLPMIVKSLFTTKEIKKKVMKVTK